MKNPVEIPEVENQVDPSQAQAVADLNQDPAAETKVAVVAVVEIRAETKAVVVVVEETRAVSKAMAVDEEETREAVN